MIKKTALPDRIRIVLASDALRQHLLQQTHPAALREVMEFIEHEKLYGLGCGLVDMVLLASTLITPGAELWTLDRRLAGLAERFGVIHQPALH